MTLLSPAMPRTLAHLSRLGPGPLRLADTWAKRARPRGGAAHATQAGRVAAILVTGTAAMLVSASGGSAASDLPPPAPPLPSGQVVEPFDMTFEEQGDGQIWLVLRYLAPRIARGSGDLAYDSVVGDLDLLCDTAGLTAASDGARHGVATDQIVITLMDRDVPRGASDPDATLFIAAYLPGPSGCEWQ